MNTVRYVLVTGAGSGIGLATARLLSQSGFQVIAGVHRTSPVTSGEPWEFHQVVMDVTDGHSIRAARDEVSNLIGGHGLFALVNNAGAGDIIPLEFTPMDRFRAVFDVNVFGMLEVTQEFLPILRHGAGRIVNIGSIGGLITIPFGASLTASKHAIEAISDAFRLELFASGIAVTCIEPASINSGSAEKLAANTEKTLASLPLEGRHRYGELLRKFTETMLRSETHGSPPEVVAEAVLAVLQTKRPPARKLVGKGGRLLRALSRVPDSLRDAVLRRVFLGNPRFGKS